MQCGGGGGISFTGLASEEDMCSIDWNQRRSFGESILIPHHPHSRSLVATANMPWHANAPGKRVIYLSFFHHPLLTPFQAYNCHLHDVVANKTPQVIPNLKHKQLSSVQLLVTTQKGVSPVSGMMQCHCLIAASI